MSVLSSALVTRLCQSQRDVCISELVACGVDPNTAKWVVQQQDGDLVRACHVLVTNDRSPAAVVSNHDQPHVPIKLSVLMLLRDAECLHLVENDAMIDLTDAAIPHMTPQKWRQMNISWHDIIRLMIIICDTTLSSSHAQPDASLIHITPTSMSTELQEIVRSTQIRLCASNLQRYGVPPTLSHQAANQSTGSLVKAVEWLLTQPEFVFEAAALTPSTSTPTPPASVGIIRILRIAGCVSLSSLLADVLTSSSLPTITAQQLMNAGVSMHDTLKLMLVIRSLQPQQNISLPIPTVSTSQPIPSPTVIAPISTTSATAVSVAAQTATATSSSTSAVPTTIPSPVNISSSTSASSTSQPTPSPAMVAPTPSTTLAVPTLTAKSPSPSPSTNPTPSMTSDSDEWKLVTRKSKAVRSAVASAAATTSDISSAPVTSDHTYLIPSTATSTCFTVVWSSQYATQTAFRSAVERVCATPITQVQLEKKMIRCYQEAPTSQHLKKCKFSHTEHDVSTYRFVHKLRVEDGEQQDPSQAIGTAKAKSTSTTSTLSSTTTSTSTSTATSTTFPPIAASKFINDPTFVDAMKMPYRELLAKTVLCGRSTAPCYKKNCPHYSHSKSENNLYLCALQQRGESRYIEKTLPPQFNIISTAKFNWKDEKYEAAWRGRKKRHADGHRIGVEYDLLQLIRHHPPWYVRNKTIMCAQGASCMTKHTTCYKAHSIKDRELHIVVLYMFTRDNLGKNYLSSEPIKDDMQHDTSNSTTASTTTSKAKSTSCKVKSTPSPDSSAYLTTSEMVWPELSSSSTKRQASIMYNSSTAPSIDGHATYTSTSHATDEDVHEPGHIYSNGDEKRIGDDDDDDDDTDDINERKLISHPSLTSLENTHESVPPSIPSPITQPTQTIYPTSAIESDVSDVDEEDDDVDIISRRRAIASSLVDPTLPIPSSCIRSWSEDELHRTIKKWVTFAKKVTEASKSKGGNVEKWVDVRNEKGLWVEAQITRIHETDQKLYVRYGSGKSRTLDLPTECDRLAPRGTFSESCDAHEFHIGRWVQVYHRHLSMEVQDAQQALQQQLRAAKNTKAHANRTKKELGKDHDRTEILYRELEEEKSRVAKLSEGKWVAGIVNRIDTNGGQVLVSMYYSGVDDDEDDDDEEVSHWYVAGSDEIHLLDNKEIIRRTSYE